MFSIFRIKFFFVHISLPIKKIKFFSRKKIKTTKGATRFFCRNHTDLFREEAEETATGRIVRRDSQQIPCRMPFQTKMLCCRCSCRNAGCGCAIIHHGGLWMGDGNK